MKNTILTKTTLTVAVAAFLATGVASAANLLTNGGFETDVLADGVSGTAATPATGWNPFVFYQGNTVNPLAADSIQPTEGDNMVQTLDSMAYQGIGVLAADTVYTFSADYYALATGSNFSLTIANGGLAPVVPSARADFGAGDLTLNEWQTISLSLDTSVETTAVGQAAFVLWGTAGQATSNGFLDNLSVTAVAVPEPASAALLFGLGGLAWVALRRR